MAVFLQQKFSNCGGLCPAVLENTTKLQVVNSEGKHWVAISSNDFDCGLFALANITAVLNDIDVFMIKFDQKEMRQHLVSYFEKKTPEVFPVESRRPKRRKKS